MGRDETISANPMHSFETGKQSWEGAAIIALADLPSLDVLRAKLLGLFNAPATKLVVLINTPASQLAQVIKAKSEKAEAA